MNLFETITLSERLLSIAVIFQTIELFQIRKSWSEQGIWRWSTLRQEWKNPLMALFFSTSGFSTLLALRIFSAAMLWVFPNPILDAFLFFSTWLISIRWRGLFNGGSDSMTIVVAIGLFVSRTFSDHPYLSKAGLAYIAVQVTLSYFIAGAVKFINPEWRNGTAMPMFLKTPRYDSPPAWIRRWFDSPFKSRTISWSLIIIECAFPLAWINPTICLIFLIIALPFHLMNYWIFGLNRFVFAWLAAYPALYFWSQMHQLN